MFAVKALRYRLGWLMFVVVMALGGVIATPVVPLVIQALTVAEAQGQAQRWLEVSRLTGTTTYRGPTTRPARIGDRLITIGQGLSTQSGSSAVLSVDNAIGTVRIAEQTDVVVRLMDILADGAYLTRLDVTRGQARIQIRPFTNPNSFFEMHTPSGIVAVRGTEFGVNVTDTGKTAVATLEGKVAASAQGRSVEVGPGLATVVIPGEPPLEPFLVDRALSLDQQEVYRGGRQLYFQAQVNPANTVRIQGREVPVSRTGRLATRLDIPYNQALVFVQVLNPLGEERTYRIRVNEIDGR